MSAKRLGSDEHLAWFGEWQFEISKSSHGSATRLHQGRSSDISKELGKLADGLGLPKCKVAILAMAAVLFHVPVLSDSTKAYMADLLLDFGRQAKRRALEAQDVLTRARAAAACDQRSDHRILADLDSNPGGRVMVKRVRVSVCPLSMRPHVRVSKNWCAPVSIRRDE